MYTYEKLLMLINVLAVKLMVMHSYWRLHLSEKGKFATAVSLPYALLLQLVEGLRRTWKTWPFSSLPRMSHPTFLQSLDCTSCWDPAVKQTRDTSSGHGEGGNKPVTGISMKFKINSHILYISTKCQSMALSYVDFYFKRHFEALQFIPCPESLLSLFT